MKEKIVSEIKKVEEGVEAVDFSEVLTEYLCLLKDEDDGSYVLEFDERN